jgi:hypothetical protein
MIQFLYPTSRQFPHDAVCECIVRALHARNFKVPGFTIELRSYGSGEQKLRCVNRIKSDQSAIDLGSHDITIKFGRSQGLLEGGAFNDCAAVREVQMPRQCLHVYEDESGPTYERYVGDDWERDRGTWWTRLNAALDQKARLCIRYSGAYPRYTGKRPHTLVWNKDDREYGPGSDDPTSFVTNTVIESFRDYLQDVVLPAIEAYPEVSVLDDVCAELPALPYPKEAGHFCTYGDGGDARRIEIGKRDIHKLPRHDRYALNGSGWRLAPLSVRSGPDLPEVAYDGFLWCSKTPKIPGSMPRYSEDMLIKVMPTDARGIYVADHAVYEKRRAEIAATLGSRAMFTDAEILDFQRARACTIVPIVEYAGNYEDPVYLINRELAFYEVEVLGKRSA